MSAEKKHQTLPNKDQQPWKRPWRDVTQDWEVDPEEGLSSEEADRRLEQYGPNRLKETERRSALSIFIEQFQNIIVLLLSGATALSFAFGEYVEGVSILAVILLNALLGFFTELRAVRSMEALRELGRMKTKVRREKSIHNIPAEKVVPGDILIIESGDVITADARLLEANRLQVDEASLTGESVPVGKTTSALKGEPPLAERENMVYKGTAVTRGSGRAVVVATGMNTQLGDISSLVDEAEEERTPLEKRLDQLGERLVWITLGIAALIAGLGIALGRDVYLILETALALAVAAVPEGLPIVATIALARGMRRMAERNALLRQLSAVETLGSTTVILTDKTGTLTENEMALQKIALVEDDILLDQGPNSQKTFLLNGQEIDPGQHPHLHQTLRTGVLCNNAELHPQDGNGEDIGDPLEIALLQGAYQAGMTREALLEEYPEEREIAFDPEVKMMATIHKQVREKEGNYLVAVKGAPEAVLRVSETHLTPQGKESLEEDDLKRWEKRFTSLAAEGYRVLALAQREGEDPSANPYQNLTFLGVVGLIDPAREDVEESIQSCQDAGVRVVMVTGDKTQTAETIAQKVNLVQGSEPDTKRGKDLPKEENLDKQVTEADIFARVDPGQKLSLVSSFQESGEIVAMTGDGVNDAPALKKADIGIAMGQRGTQVAKEAAAMVLKDDAFSTIVAAIEQGRNIFNNIRKFALYLLSCNTSEIFVVSIASFTSLPLPIRPLQILYLNLVTDVFPALALGVGAGNPQIMKRPPRDPDEPILTQEHWWGISAYALLISLSVLGAFGLALARFEMGLEKAVTVGFLTLAFAQLWHVFNMRGLGTGVLRNEVTENPAIWGALVLCIGLLLLATYLPFLANLLETVPLGLQGWMLVIPLSLVPLVLGQIGKALGWGRT
ncbi:MAG: cation-transporting P-type ATPase [Anaerolineales bacterium]